MIEIVKDPNGVEYKVIKRNRVNWMVESLDGGGRWNWPHQALTHVRYEEEKTEWIDPMVRIGARVVIKKDAAARKNPKFAKDADKTFVLIGFGKAPGDFKAIEMGGNARNSYWSLSGKDMIVV